MAWSTSGDPGQVFDDQKFNDLRLLISVISSIHKGFIDRTRSLTYINNISNNITLYFRELLYFAAFVKVTIIELFLIGHRKQVVIMVLFVAIVSFLGWFVGEFYFDGSGTFFI